MKPRIIVVGASGHAKVIGDAIICGGSLELVGFTALESDIETLFDVPVILGEDALLQSLTEDPELRVVVGIGDNHTRRRVVAWITGAGFGERFVSVVHPGAIVGRGVKLGDGTAVMAGVVLNPDAVVGRHAILNTNCSVDHDCRLGDFVSIAPGATLGGNVTVGEASVIGLGARVIHGVSVGHDTVVGAGSLVVRDLPPLTVAYGAPARPIRPRQPSDRYL